MTALVANRSRHEADAVDDVVASDLEGLAILTLDGDAAVVDLGDGGVQVGRNLVVLHRVTQEGGVGKAGSLSSNQVAGVLDNDRVLALEDQVVSCLAGGLAAAEEQDLVADFLLLLEQFGEAHGLLEARDHGHGSRHGAGGHDDLVEAAHGAKVGDLGVEADVDALLRDFLLVPLNEFLVVLFEAHRGSGEEQAAELVGLFEEDRLVAALFEDKRALHAADAAADDGDLLRALGRNDLILVVLHGRRVQRAAAQVQGILRALDVRRALELREVEAAVVAADAGLDLVLTALEDLVNPLGVNEVLTRDGNCIETAGSDLFRGLDRIHTAGAGDGLVGELLDVLDVLEVAVVGHVLRRMCPVPCVVSTVVAVEHVVAGIAQVLDGLLGLGHVTAELFEVGLIRHSALAPSLGLGDDGVTQGHREVGAGLTLDGLHDLDRETETVLERAAVLVGTMVPVGDGELVKQIAFVDSVDLNAVDTGLTQQLCGLAERIDHLVDLFDGHRAGEHVLLPTVRGSGSGSAAVADVDNGLGKGAEHLVVVQSDHPGGNSHGAAETSGELNEQLGAGLVVLNHVVGEFLKHLLVLPEPSAAHGVTDTLHAREDQTDAVLRTVEQEVRSFLIKVAGLQPSKQRGAAHGALDNAVFDFDIANLPRSK